MEIVWNKRPSKFLAQALKRISADSVLQAERVEEGLLNFIQGITANPEKYPPDKYKKNNLGNYRAFEHLSFRIAHKITPNQIRILRTRDLHGLHYSCLERLFSITAYYIKQRSLNEPQTNQSRVI